MKPLTTAQVSPPPSPATDGITTPDEVRAVPLSTVSDSEKSSTGWRNLLTPLDRLMLAAGRPELVKWPAK